MSAISSSSDSTTGSLKGKRKKKVAKNANPLFTKWLSEWKQEASEKGWKSAHTYAKALKTLKLFPISLETGKDCKLLKNFGDKICKMLDEKLEEYKNNQDLHDNVPSHSHHEASKTTEINGRPPFSERYNYSNCLGNTSEPAENDVTNSGQTFPAAADQMLLSSRNTFTNTEKPRVHEISDNSDSDLECLPPPEKLQKQQKSSVSCSRKYIPAYRSGPYALIRTLFRYMKDPEFIGHMSKSELAHASQPLSDKSFTVPDPGSRYTAWSSMGTLIKKGYMSKSGNPARYSLTDSGYTLGLQLETAENQGITNNETPCPTTSSGSAHLHHAESLDRLNTGTLSHSQSSDQRKSETNDITGPVSTNQNYNLELSDSEDEDLEQAVAASLLSFSQEQSNSFSSYSTSPGPKLERTPSSFAPGSSSSRNAQETANILQLSPPSCSSPTTHDLNGDIFVVSDDEDDCDVTENGWGRGSVTTKKATLHISPSPSPPLQTYNPGSPIPSQTASTTQSIGFGSSHSPVKHKSDKTSPSWKLKNQNSSEGGFQLSTKCSDSDVLEVSDDSDHDTGNVNFVLKPCDKIQNNYAIDNSDDDLPDLVLPLASRLLQKGMVKSDLLKDTAMVAANSPSSSSTVSSLGAFPSSYAGGNGDQYLHVRESSGALSRGIIANTEQTESLDVNYITNRGYKNLSKSSTSSDTYDGFDIENCNNVQSNTIAGLQNRPKPSNSACDSLNVQSSHVSSLSSSTSSPVTSASQCLPIFTLQPGTFDIILCLDNREFYGSKSNGKTLLPELMKSGVQCDLRLLHVGDLLWIARERVGPQVERVQGRELVLNYIVERKRMDDLVNSMTDGRMKEQKFRLKHCGLSEAIILIEEYGSIQNFSLSEDRIRQSISNSQIIDGFKVKRCGGTKDAVMYLAMMTSFLQQHFSTKTLHGISVEHAKLIKGQQHLTNSEHHLMPFDAFNEASVKHKDLTVKELFAKQLIQIPGVSADRAKAITNVYPTLTLLLEAYERCPNDKEKEKLLSGIKCGKKERNLGIAISRTMCMLYTQTGSLS